MKRIITAMVCACTMLMAALAGDEEVTVKVSVAGVNNSALKKQCEVQGKKAAILYIKQKKDTVHIRRGTYGLEDCTEIM